MSTVWAVHNWQVDGGDVERIASTEEAGLEILRDVHARTKVDGEEMRQHVLKDDLTPDCERKARSDRWMPTSIARDDKGRWSFQREHGFEGWYVKAWEVADR